MLRDNNKIILFKNQRVKTVQNEKLEGCILCN